MLFCFYLSLKCLQTYNGPVLYVLILCFVSIQFLLLSYITKEPKNINFTKQLSAVFILKSFLMVIYIKTAVFVPIEIAPIIRRLSQFSSGVIIDKQKFNKTELIGLSIIITFIFMIFN